MIPVLALLLALAAAAGPLDLNAATVSELDGLPGIGRVKAESIVAHREANGPFRSVASLAEVSGIGPGTLAALEGRVRVGPAVLAAATRGRTSNEARLPAIPSASAVDPNTATLVELAALPGISGPRAEAIVADRERNGPFATCDELVRVDGIGPATVAGLRGLCTVP